MRNAASFQVHTSGPLNYVDYDADEKIAEQLAYANQAPAISLQRGFRYWLTRNLTGAIGLALIAVSAAGAAAMATWNVLDPSINYAASGDVQNALGTSGAIVADLAMQFFGLGAILFVLIVAIFGWRLLFGQTLHRLKRRLGYTALALICAAGAASSLPVAQNWPLPMGMGGVTGDVLIWLPVAGFGQLFAGPIGYITAAIFGGLSATAFVFSIWQPAVVPVAPEQPSLPYGVPEEEYENDEPTHSRFGWLSFGAAAHVALSAQALAGRTMRSMFQRKPRKLGKFRAVQPAQNPYLKDAGTHNYEPHFVDQQAAPAMQPIVAEEQWEDGDWAAYEEQHVDLYENGPREVPAQEWQQQWNDPAPVAVAQAPMAPQPTTTRTIHSPAPARVPASQPESRKTAPTPRVHPSQTKRVSVPATAPKKGSRARKEAQPDLLGSSDYELPSLHMLSNPPAIAKGSLQSADSLEQNARLLEGVLEDFGVRGEIINVRPGPVVTLYELEPAPGIKSSRVIGLADDIARSMSAIAARVAVIPGRNVIGIELPNAKRDTVFLRELLDSADFEKTKAKLALCLGKNIGGEAVIADLAKMPHVLVAGTTGSGKSVAINTMILSLLYRMTPEECRLIMIDPKMLELSVYDGIPHLLTPVVTDPKKAVVALKWTVREMEDRYKKMSKLGVRNIDGFNSRVKQAKKKGEVISRTIQTGFDHDTGEAIYEQEELNLEPMPYIVVLIDEMADLMMVAGKEIEGTVQRLAQMARAAGIHVIMATQRPSVDVITGTIKANFPTRISFQVTSKIDSRTILGEQGAEQLLGMGDMLYMAGGGRIQRVHGPFVSDTEVEEIVAHLQSQGVPEYLDAITDEDEVETSAVLEAMTGGGDGGESDLYDQAVAIVLRDKKASTSYVQRRLSIGYNRAASIIERMEEEGVISSPNHAGKRVILVGNAEDTI
ncbi:MAG: cell division protein FtsK [Hyphomicrobiales bacterium]|nr:MAG: cell division protein FtsK [Hyphomicrobiales bacterium]